MTIRDLIQFLERRKDAHGDRTVTAWLRYETAADEHTVRVGSQTVETQAIPLPEVRRERLLNEATRDYVEGVNGLLKLAYDRRDGLAISQENARRAKGKMAAAGRKIRTYKALAAAAPKELDP